MDFALLDISCKRILQFMLFCTRLFSLSIMFARFTPCCSIDQDSISLLFHNHIPLYGYTTFYWSIHQVTGVGVVFTCFTIVTDAAMSTDKQMSMRMYVFIPFGQTDEKSLDHMVSKFNHLRKRPDCSSSACGILCSHRQCSRVPISPRPPQSLLLCFGL